MLWDEGVVEGMKRQDQHSGWSTGFDVYETLCVITRQGAQLFD